MNKKIILLVLVLSFVIATAGCIGGYDKSVQAEEGLAQLDDPEIPAEIQNHVDLEEVGIDTSDGNLVVAIETYGDIPSYLEKGETTYEVSITNQDEEIPSEMSLSLNLFADRDDLNTEKPGEDDFEAEYEVDGIFFGGSEVIFEIPLEEIEGGIDDPENVGVQVTSSWSDGEDGFDQAMDFVPIDEDGGVDNYIEYEI